MRRPRPPEQPWYLELRRPPTPPPQAPRPPRGHRPAAPGPRPPVRRDHAQPKAAAGQRPTPAAPPSRPSRALLIATAITGLLALTVLLAWVLRGVGGSGPVELDVSRAQDGVRQVLTDPIDGYGRTDVTNVRCNNGVNPTVRSGTSFTCSVTVDGAARQVRVEFVDDAGTYAVDRPR
ncbi:DUF4333 domain-containing protein [Mycolicibacter arupensis]|uniref:DUF4333 domain-containing protein n=1 Tax=Mycolicibacter arupensis TaxID=342002 RepID=UPI001F391D45|nr:DUF4333 domain-containing protein [Mycolicibacter arupensis]